MTNIDLRVLKALSMYACAEQMHKRFRHGVTNPLLDTLFYMDAFSALPLLRRDLP